MAGVNPYPWLPDWYWQLYASTIDQYNADVIGIQRTARERGFDVRVTASTPPQIGSAGTVTMRISCSTLGMDDTRLFDDRVILSFGGDYLRFLQWWVRTTACAQFQAQLTERKLRPGWKPNREAALVLSEALGKIK